MSLRGEPWQKSVGASPSTSSVRVSGQASAAAHSSTVSCANSHSYLARHGLQIGIASDASARSLRQHEAEEDDADDSVHGEEGRVEPAQVTGTHDGVLVREQGGHGTDAEPVEGPEVEPEADRGQQSDSRRMRVA